MEKNIEKMNGSCVKLNSINARMNYDELMNYGVVQKQASLGQLKL